MLFNVQQIGPVPIKIFVTASTRAAAVQIAKRKFGGDWVAQPATKKTNFWIKITSDKLHVATIERVSGVLSGPVSHGHRVFDDVSRAVAWAQAQSETLGGCQIVHC